MDGTSRRKDRLTALKVFGAIPCIIGLGAGLYLRWSDTVWLSSAGSFWPILLVVISITTVVKRAISPFDERSAAVAGWLALAWAWFYVPLWLTASPIPQSSAVVARDGQVHRASEVSRHSEGAVWLFTSLAGKRFVLNVEGTATIEAVDVRYRFADPYVAKRRHREDAAQPVLAALTAALASEAGKSRSSRAALFDNRTDLDRFVRGVCQSATRDANPCPVALHFSPQSEATAPGAVWAKYHNEQEAIAEKHLPTLVHMLTDESSRLMEPGRVFALLMELADKPEMLARLAQNARLLDEAQFARLIERILLWPGAGNEAVGILARVNRLTEEQRRGLRAKALGEAGIGVLCSHAAGLRLGDGEIAELARRMPAEFKAAPQVAVLALETFGERLPAETQRGAVEAVAGASHALAALRRLNFSPALRAELLQKLLAETTAEDFDPASLAREKLEDTLTPAEMRLLIANAVEKSEHSRKWLEFAARKLPIRKMTGEERKSVLTGLLFESSKTAFEFASENRRYFEAADINEITRDYARTIEPSMCLHLSHRNKNRRLEFFSEDQLQILRECASAK